MGLQGETTGADQGKKIKKYDECLSVRHLYHQCKFAGGKIKLLVDRLWQNVKKSSNLTQKLVKKKIPLSFSDLKTELEIKHFYQKTKYYSLIFWLR